MGEKVFDPQLLGEKIIKVLKTIFDPEIPVDIYELGLIYDVFVNEDFDAKVLMTLTSPNCPLSIASLFSAEPAPGNAIPPVLAVP